jgi:poly(A) polymerase
MTEGEATLDRQPWLAHPATLAVMSALEAAGGPDCARFVGGCVRDAVVGRPVNDIDIATRLAPEAVVAALEAAGLRALPTGIEHGTITALVPQSGGRPRLFEITTLRRDVETDGRHAVVAFATDWAEDAARRDFRLNALYADMSGRIFDPVGGGLADARAGAIVFVGDPAQRIREDALRIARYFRFLAWFGRGEPDAAALEACRGQAALVEKISAERVGQEIMKLLAASDPRVAMGLMAKVGVLARLIPDAVNLARFDALVELETGVLFAEDPLLRLAALLPSDPDAARRVSRALRLSKTQRDRLAAALGPEPALVSWMSPRETRRLVYRLGVEAFVDRATLAWAASPRPAAAIQWRALLPMAQTWTPPTLPLTGDEVAAAGVPRGPQIGAVLREVEAWWIDQDFLDDKLSIMERLKAVAQGMTY